MSPITRRRLSRGVLWGGAVAVPLAVVAAVLLPVAAGASVDLPDKTPAELLSFAAESDVDALQGTISQTSALGIPDLGAFVPDEDGRGGGAAATSDDALSLLTGSFTANVFVDGERARLQVLDQLAERNVYLDGDTGEAWFVDSESQTATRYSADKTAADALARHVESTQPITPEASDLPTPEAMLEAALARLDESTEVTVGTDTRLAGREVYELILEPRTPDTLIGEVRFAIDGETGAALGAWVTAQDASEPAYALAFSSVEFAAPDASSLTFTPGSGVEVVERDVPIPTPAEFDAWLAKAKTEADAVPSAGAVPAVVGEGWSAVVVVPAPVGADGHSALDASALSTVTRAVDGGRVLETALVTVLFADDGRTLVGAVPAEVLIAAAQG